MLKKMKSRMLSGKKANLVLGFMLIILLALSSSLMAANQVVDNNADAGVGTTLREAIAAVGDGETITFNISDSDIITISAELSISESMTINGYNNATGNDVTVQVTTPGTFRVFNINASGETNISNMTIKGGDITGNGGGINIATGTVNLDNVTVTGSKAANGGGIYSAGILTVNNCTITGCEATDNTSMNNGGGGILSSSTLVVNNSTISDNKAANGGGILDSSTTTVNGCDFLTNECNDNGSGYGGGGLCVNSGTTTLQGTNTFTGNYGIGVGDGVYIRSGSLNAGSSTLNINDEFYNWWTSTFIYGTSTVVYGGESQSISKADPPFNTYLNYYNLTLNGTGEHIAYGNFTVNNNLVVNTDINLNGKIITLGETATLSENTGICKGTSGTIKTTRNLSNINENVAGLGAEITTSANMGSTTIIRGHAVQTGGGNSGIKRFYDITPNNNSGLDATLVFNYLESELDGQTESTLQLWRSTDEGSTWSSEGGSVNTTNNTITLSGIDGFSRWTASDSDHTLPVELSAFTAQFIENTPTLYWTTQSETDNMGWFVYRNREEDFASSHKVSEFIEGHGTTSQQQSYLYEDRIQDPEVGDKYYYWLESIDFSGMVNHYDKVAILTIPDNSNSGNQSVLVPERFGLLQNEPNPVVNSARIAFNLTETAQIDLNIYNIKGQLVKKLYSGVTSKHTVMWNGKDSNGNELAPGVYFYNLIVNGKTQETKKLIIMK